MFVYFKPLIDKVINVEKLFFHFFYCCEQQQILFLIYLLYSLECHENIVM